MPYIGASPLYHSKITLVHQHKSTVAIAELKVWKVPKSASFPEGVKYSMFLVEEETGQVLVGYDNHKPKGHHIHNDGTEQIYEFQSVSTLIEDFWTNVNKRGFLT